MSELHERMENEAKKFLLIVHVNNIMMAAMVFFEFAMAAQNRNIYYAKFFFEKVAPFCSTCLAYLYYATFPLLGYMIVSCVFFLTGAFFQLGKKSNDTIYNYCRSSASTLDSLW
jgi:hypothetical protein